MGNLKKQGTIVGLKPHIPLVAVLPYSYSSFPGVIIEFPSGKLPSSSTGSTLCPISSNFGLDVAPLDGPGGRGSDGCHHCPHCVEHCRGNSGEAAAATLCAEIATLV